MSDGTEPTEAHTGSWRRIDLICKRFEAAWKEGKRPQIKDYIGLDSSIDRSGLRRKLLVELVMIDLEYRWRSGAKGAGGQEAPPSGFPTQPRLADYVGRYKDFGPFEDLPDELIGEEYRARQLWGDRPSREEYVAQFGQKRPKLGDVLARVDEQLTAGRGGHLTSSVSAPVSDTRAKPVSPGSQKTEPVGVHSGGEAAEKAKDPSAALEYGNYRVVKSFAKGGMGRLSIAQDKGLNRHVVLKEIRESLAKDPKSRRRFVTEARITGQLEHPGVVPVYALGTDRRGRPFYTMRRVRGETLDKAIAGYHQEPSLGRLRELLRRFIAVCQTIAFAHDRRVVHRDLKPSNIMVGKYGETLVLDWGLAKPVAGVIPSKTAQDHQAHRQAGEFPDLTELGARLGTAPYMAPEQADPGTEALGPAVDIYGLGSILYQLLAGKPPYTGKSSPEILKKVRSSPPEKPSEVRREVPRAVEAICLKAMARRPAARYLNAGALAADVQHWLDDEPVRAYPEPWLPRASRWARHHKTATASVLVFLFTAVLAAAVAGPVVVAQRAQARAAQQTAEEYKRQADAATALADQKDKEAEQADKERDEAQVQSVKHLEAAMAATSEAHAARARVQQLGADLQANEGQAQKVEELRRELGQTRTQLVAVEGRVAEETERARIARDKADELQEESAKLKQEAQRLRELSGELSRLASGEPPKVAAVEPEPSPLADFTEGDVDRFDVITSDAAFSLLTRDWSRRQTGKNSLRIDSLSQGQVRVGYPSTRNADWDLSAQNYVNLALFTGSRTSGELQNLWVRLGRGSSYAEYQPDPRIVDRARDRWLHTSIPLSGDHHWTRSDTNEADLSHVDWIEVHASTTGTGLTFCLDNLGFATEPVLSWIRGPIPTPAKLAGITRWQLGTIAPRFEVRAMAWSPDGRHIACGTRGNVRIYDASTLRLVRLLVGHTSFVWSVAWSPDGQQLASASQDKTLRLWEIDGTPGPVLQVPGDRHQFFSVAWSPDGRRLASGDSEGTIRLWEADGTPGPALKGHTGSVRSVAWSPDGQWLASGGDDNTVGLWERDGTPGRLLEGHTGTVWSVTWGPGGRRLASASEDATIRLWQADGTPGSVLESHTGGVKSVAWSPDGGWLVSAGSGGPGPVRLWEADGMAGPVFEKLFERHGGHVLSVAWSPDGQRLVAAGAWGIRLLEADGTLGPVLDRQVANVWSVAWSPDGQRLASAGWDGKVRLWDTRGVQKRVFGSPDSLAFSVAWSPDGDQLATGAYLNVRLWTTDGEPGPVFKGHTGNVVSVAWHPSGRRLASASRDNTVRLWGANGTPGPVLEGHTDWVPSVAWTPDGRRIASGSLDNTVRLWEADGTPGPVLEGHTLPVGCVAWSPSGQWLASASQDNTVRLWAPDCTPGAVLQGHGPVAWSPDGRWLASGYQEVFRLWHADGTPGPVLQGNAYGPMSLAWHPDGHRLTSGSEANTILQWDVDTGEPQWVALLLNDGESVTFDPAGKILHGDPDVIEEELVYLVQKEPGKAMELLTPSEFQKRVAASGGKAVGSLYSGSSD